MSRVNLSIDGKHILVQFSLGLRENEPKHAAHLSNLIYRDPDQWTEAPRSGSIWEVKLTDFRGGNIYWAKPVGDCIANGANEPPLKVPLRFKNLDGLPVASYRGYPVLPSQDWLIAYPENDELWEVRFHGVHQEKQILYALPEKRLEPEGTPMELRPDVFRIERTDATVGEKVLLRWNPLPEGTGLVCRSGRRDFRFHFADLPESLRHDPPAAGEIWSAIVSKKLTTIRLGWSVQPLERLASPLDGGLFEPLTFEGVPGWTFASYRGFLVLPSGPWIPKPRPGQQWDCRVTGLRHDDNTIYVAGRKKLRWSDEPIPEQGRGINFPDYAMVAFQPGKWGRLVGFFNGMKARLMSSTRLPPSIRAGRATLVEVKGCSVGPKGEAYFRVRPAAP